MKHFIRLAAALMAAFIMVRAPAYAAGADRNGLKVKGTPAKSTAGASDAAATKGSDTRRNMNFAEAKETGTLKVITKTVGGRNLLVPESDKNSGKQITIKKIPATSLMPDDILNLPDNGSELKELMQAPGGAEKTGIGGIDEGTARRIRDKSRVSSRYPYVLLYGDVDDAEFNDFTQYMDRLIREDPGLINEAVNNGWKIVLTGYDLDVLIFGGETDGVEGCTYFPEHGGSGTVYVHAGEHSYCVIHEMGHVLDYISGLPSQSEAFEAIFNKEASNLTSYGETAPLEFFAEAYMNDILQKGTAKAACPDAVQYVTEYKDRINRIAS